MELVFIIAGLALVLIAVPVIAPHVGLVGGAVCMGVAVKFFLRAQVAATPLPPGAALPKFRWDVDMPIAVAAALYGVLWIGIAIVSLRAERAAEAAEADDDLIPIDIDPAASLA
jgi:hypothetical protein